MTPDEFRRLGYALIDWIADYRERMPALPVMSPAQPGDIKRLFAAAPPVAGTPLGATVLPHLASLLPGITHWNHPRFFAYFPSNTSLASVLADLLSAGLGAQAMSWQTSPAATELEEVVLDWLRQMLGLPSEFHGVIQDTASATTLIALLCARERTTALGQDAGGLQAGHGSGPLVVYASQEAHSSVAKAVRLAGFGEQNLRRIETDASTHALRLDALEAAIRADLAVGRHPCALVATTGTTTSTACDPIAGCAALAERHGLWLHVDAALAGSAMILPECRPLWAGIERADSLVLNPHKWLGTGFDLSTYYIRDVPHLLRVMSTSPSYLRTAQDGAVRNFRDWGIPLGRRFRALKLWFVLMDQGVAGLQARLRRDLEHARWLGAAAQATPGWHVMAPVVLQTVCLRHAPEERFGGDEAAGDAHNLALAQRVNQSGGAYVTPALLKGRQVIRVSIGAEATERSDVEAVWHLLQDAARAG